MPVVTDFDQLQAAGGDSDRNAPGARIQRVFDQFLERAGRALDHLARGDAIDELGGQPSY